MVVESVKKRGGCFCGDGVVAARGSCGAGGAGGGGIARQACFSLEPAGSLAGRCVTSTVGDPFVRCDVMTATPRRTDSGTTSGWF